MQQAALIDYSITVASMLLPTRSLLDSAAGKPSEPSNDCSDGSREAWAGLCELSGSELESSDGDEGEGPSSGGNVPARRTPGCSPHGVNPLTLQFCTDAHEQQFAAYHAAHLQTTDGGWNTQSAGLLPFCGLHSIWRGPGLSWSTALPPILQAWPSSPASASSGEGHPGRRPVLHPSELFTAQLVHNVVSPLV
ncbi:hypothetical protein ABPG77_009573 [Micractinium sp. CCAP 211/92]